MASEIAEYERCLVAGCKRRPAIIDELRIQLADFSDSQAATVFKAIESIRRSGREVDEVSLYQEARGIPLSYIATLPEAATANAAWYLERVREAGLRRRIKSAVGRIAETVDREDMDSTEILDAMDKEVTALGDSERAEIVWLKDVLKAAVEDIQRRAQHPELACTGIESGYWDLDALTDGFQPGELIIIAARPSLGKTALAVSLIVNIAVRGKTMCGFFSSEMSEVLIGQRFLANVGRFNLGHVRRGVIAKTDANGLLAAANELYHEQVLLNATPNIKLTDLKGLARCMVRRGARLLVVDYLTLIQHGDVRTPRHERVGEVSKQLKGLARELNVPIIALSQLARTAEGKEPNIAELRQSGEIEEDADMVMLMHRERDEVSDAIPTKLIIAKNRNGPCGNVSMVFHARCGRFDLEAQR
jgi:replicative DNA helicase